jgi:twinkle protein
MGQVIRKEQCPGCVQLGQDKSGDNLAVYDDGSSYCFACDKLGSAIDQIKAGEAIATSVSECLTEVGGGRKKITGSFVELTDRGISKETCEKFGVQVGNANGKVIIHNFFSDGTLIDQKIRSATDKNKQFWSMGSKTNRLFGMDRQNPTTKVPVVVTEGEYDAMCIYEETGLPAVSITKGAAGAAKQLAQNLEWLQQWKSVILCFDQDEAGEKAIEKSVKVFETTSVKVVHLPLKDANDMVLAGRGPQLKKYLWDAQLVRKPSMVNLSSIKDLVMVQPKCGADWPWKSMTEITFGLRMSEITVVVAGEGIGKTEFIKEIFANHIAQNKKVGLFSLEQDIEETGQRLVASILNKPIYIPESPLWDDKEISAALDTFNDNVYLYDSSAGALTLDKLVINLKYMKNAHGVDLIIIDNLTALCANPYIDGKRMSATQYVGEVMTKLQEVTRQLKIHVIIAAHTNKDQVQLKRSFTANQKTMDTLMEMGAEGMNKMTTPPGSTWETGRCPNTTHILGSGNTARLADHVIALYRNKEAEEDLERRTTNVKFLKTGRKNPARTKNGFKLLYNYDTGKLEEL